MRNVFSGNTPPGQNVEFAAIVRLGSAVTM